MAKLSYESLSDSSRIWIYRSDRLLSAEETLKVDNWLNQFTEKWTAHNQSLKAFGQVYHSKFIVILLDEESSNQASGCSIDSQVRFIKDIGAALNIDFFDRLHFDFLIDNSRLSEVSPATINIFESEFLKLLISNGWFDLSPQECLILY